MNSWLVDLGLAGGLKVAQTIISSHGEREQNNECPKTPQKSHLDLLTNTGSLWAFGVLGWRHQPLFKGYCICWISTLTSEDGKKLANWYEAFRIPRPWDIKPDRLGLTFSYRWQLLVLIMIPFWMGVDRIVPRPSLTWLRNDTKSSTLPFLCHVIGEWMWRVSVVAGVATLTSWQLGKNRSGWKGSI